jgi:hypothetical protein
MPFVWSKKVSGSQPSVIPVVSQQVVETPQVVEIPETIEDVLDKVAQEVSQAIEILQPSNTEEVTEQEVETAEETPQEETE